MARSSIHDIFPELTPRAEIFKKVNLLEKNWLDQASLCFPIQAQQALREFCYVQILGNRCLYEQENGALSAIGFLPNLLEALYGQHLPFAYCIHSLRGKITVHLGTQSSGWDSLKALAQASVGPELVQESQPASDLAGFRQCAALTGISGSREDQSRPRAGGTQTEPFDLQQFISGLISQDWIYLVLAFPIPREQAGQWFEACAREIKDIKEAFLLGEMQKHNRMAAHYTDVLEKTLKRLRQGKQLGLWQTGLYVFSESRNTAAAGAAMLQALLSDSKSRPEALRSHLCSGSEGVSPQINCLTSRELVLPVSLPGKEYPGFCLREQADFDLDQRPLAGAKIPMGRILDHGSDQTQDWEVPVADLCKHALVAGLTGSGKTNTIFQILTRLQEEHQLPFLVIEPAKSEYHNLLGRIPGLKVFTLGDERPNRSAPFRLNPFAFPHGVSLQTHLDMLKAVFQASFVMYAPMPYILEECLHRIYEDKGWNLVTSSNIRGVMALAYPTLSDLSDKVEQVVDSIGYDDRLTMDIKSALKTRIKNLCLGGKGQMLNTRSSLPWSELMDGPVVLELKAMGSDEDKAFLMGLILMAIWEHYESRADSLNTAPSGLRHLTVIEEAHRLLKNVPTEKSSEEMSNVKGKGVETFCNLFAEIRAYGQGFLISEQIPSKLAPDVVKNSNLKIMHRMVAKEDRDILGESMNLSPAQQRQVVSLETGQAVCFQEGMDRAIKVIVPLSGLKQGQKAVSSEEVCQTMEREFFSTRSEILDRFMACRFCPDHKTNRCARIRQAVDEERTAPNWTKDLVLIFLPFVLDPQWGSFQTHLSHVKDLPPEQVYCFSAQASQDFLQAKGDFFHWSYDLIQERIGQAQDEIASGNLARIMGQFQTKVGQGLFSLCRDRCKMSTCVCGYEISVIAEDAHLHNQLLSLLKAPEYGPRFYQELIILLVESFRDVLPADLSSFIPDLARCYLIRKLHEHRISLRLQRDVLESFDTYLQKSLSL